MIRVIGSALLAGGSVLLGLCAVRHLKSRVHDLRLLIAGFETMMREMDYRLAPLPELLRCASNQTEGRVKLFFQLCSQGAEHLNGRTFQAVWGQAAEASQLRLERGELTLIEQLGGVLGRYDGDSQRQALAEIISRLEQCSNAAAEQSDRLGRVYSVLGLTAGVFLVIMLL